MRPDRTGRVVWWTIYVVLPVMVLLAASAALSHSRFDRASLVPFFDEASGTFPLRREWLFDDVLHIGGRALVVVATVGLIVWAAIGWRSPRWRGSARRAAYLATCLLVTVSVAGIWKDLADRVTPWNTVGFGGSRPWPEQVGWIDSPGAHAASGFAWLSLYFVGAALSTRHRWLWLAPGLLLGGLFALGQHVRGAHQPSHEPLSAAIAWVVAAVVAVAFRRAGWLDWSERPRSRTVTTALDSFSERSLPWLASGSLALAGALFFAVDQVSGVLEGRIPEFHQAVEVVELMGTSLGVGITAWLLVDKIAAMRTRSLRKLREERERRLQMLGSLAASVAHEVRNPLHTLRLIIDEQRLEIPALDTHALRSEVEVSLERIDHAVELVYRLARPEFVESESGDLAETTRDAVAGLERIAPGRGRFEWGACPSRAPVAASRFDVRLVVDNLLRNAADASPRDRPVSLDLRFVDDTWELRIANEGALEARPRSPDSPSGLGLGLAISRQIIEHAQGTLSVVQEAGIVHSTIRLPVLREARLAE
ncbi:MAG: ATP-binding protein [Planctomycetota bacterium]